MITFSNKYRSEQSEIMDSIDFHGDEMDNVLKDLNNVNKWLGGNSITIDGIQKLLQNYPKSNRYTLLDIGCGNGEMLRKCVSFGKRHGYNFECIGIDFNENILETAKKQSIGFPNIKYEKVDIFLEENLIPNCDIALCTLVLHHFKNEQIEALLKKLIQKVNVGIVINDLHRNKQAFTLFKIVSAMFFKSKTARHDGLVSIARGFKKNEIELLSKQIPNQKSEINWHWAYRYQWILKKEL